MFEMHGYTYFDFTTELNYGLIDKRKLPQNKLWYFNITFRSVPLY